MYLEINECFDEMVSVFYKSLTILKKNYADHIYKVMHGLPDNFTKSSLRINLQNAKKCKRSLLDVSTHLIHSLNEQKEDSEIQKVIEKLSQVLNKDKILNEWTGMTDEGMIALVERILS